MKKALTLSAKVLVLVTLMLTQTQRGQAFVSQKLPISATHHPPKSNLPIILQASNINDNEESQSSIPTKSRALVCSLAVSLALVFTPIQSAHAGYGPSSGATTSPIPGLVKPRIQEQDLDGKKLKQLIDSSLDERRLNEFSSQLDDVIFSLKQRKQQSMMQDGGTSFFGDEDELLKAEGYQQQIQRREALLEKLEAQPYWFNYLAAFIGSVVSTSVVHPVDTIKTRLMLKSTVQTTSTESEPELESEVEPETTMATEYSNTTKEEIPIVMEGHNHNHNHNHDHHHDKLEEGLFDNLYEGLTGNILKEGPPSALYLGVYETVKLSLVPKSNPEYLLLVYLVAGAAGETVGSVVRAPAEALKSLVQSKAAGSALEAAKSIATNPDEQKNLIRAWSASVCRDVPFGAIQLAIFELVKAYILNSPDIDFDSSTLQGEAIVGAFAGAIGSFLTNPGDVVTTRIITQPTGADAQGEKPLNVFSMAKKIYEQEGIGAFFYGWQARVGYWAPSISIFLTCYCSVRQAGVRFEIF